MKIYNTLTKKTEEFVPIKNGQVSLYTCGPTVYDFAHIGNLRSFVFDDTLRRVLEASRYKVRHVMNITDVGHLSSDGDEGEDKLENGALRDKKTVWDVANFYIDQFIHDARALNIREPNAYEGRHGPYPRATDFISQQVEIVDILLKKEVAYISEQAIYFEVTKLPDYGKLSGQKLSDKEVGARQSVITDKNKHHPQDFALWFFKTGRFANHSMSWPSPWGEGFPGWHLECSAIIHATLGEPLDIHTGGVDHIGTHHTNEIAQTIAAYGVELSNYWMHNEHLLVAGHKMSKSKGNYYTLKNVIDKNYSPLALRLLYLQSHYRKQMDFTWGALEASDIRLHSYMAFADLRYQVKSEAKQLPAGFYLNLQEEIVSISSQDLNTPGLLAKIDESIDYIYQNAWGVHPDNESSFLKLLEIIDNLLGLKLLSSDDITTDQKQLLAQREKHRREQDWQASDKLRLSLTNQGVEVSDLPSGQIWRRL